MPSRIKQCDLAELVWLREELNVAHDRRVRIPGVFDQFASRRDELRDRLASGARVGRGKHSARLVGDLLELNGETL